MEEPEFSIQVPLDFFDDFHCTEKERANARAMTAMCHGSLTLKTTKEGFCHYCSKNQATSLCPSCKQLYCFECQRICTSCHTALCRMCTTTTYQGNQEIVLCPKCDPQQASLPPIVIHQIPQ